MPAGRADSDKLSSLLAHVPARVRKQPAGLTLTGRWSTVQLALESKFLSYPLNLLARIRYSTARSVGSEFLGVTFRKVRMANPPAPTMMSAATQNVIRTPGMSNR